MKLMSSGRTQAGGHQEIAFVLAILVVHDDDHAPARSSSRISSTEFRPRAAAGALTCESEDVGHGESLGR